MNVLQPLTVHPPATSTWPLIKRVAVWKYRPTTSMPAEDQVPEAGSYNSAPVKTDPLPSSPPVTSTLPSGNVTEGKLFRASAIDPVGVHSPDDGL